MHNTESKLVLGSLDFDLSKYVIKNFDDTGFDASLSMKNEGDDKKTILLNFHCELKSATKKK